MKIFNSHYFIIYQSPKIISLFFFCCFWLACSSQNSPKQISSAQNQTVENPSAININTATAEQLEKLPGIGAAKARTIIEQREKYGAFRKPEHLLLVRGIGERRFRAIRNLIKAE